MISQYFNLSPIYFIFYNLYRINSSVTLFDHQADPVE